MSRSQLHALVRDLRQYLQWQAVPLTGSTPAAPDEIALHEERHKAIAERKLKQALAPAPRPAESPRARTEEIPRKAPSQAPPREVEPAASGGGSGAQALWKDASFGSRPRQTFARTPVETPWTDESLSAADKLAAIRAEIGDCERCKLCENRKNIVFGVGNPEARLMFVGEGPGGDEDIKGEPFVGKAGQLLDKMIGAMGLSREEVYIANVVKCRPPQNRDPETDEVTQCSPFLRQQIAAIQPEVIVALGKFSGNMLTGKSGSLGAIRGKWHSFEGIPLMPTFHPAYLLRTPAGKRDAWTDLQAVMAKLGLDG